MEKQDIPPLPICTKMYAERLFKLCFTHKRPILMAQWGTRSPGLL